MLAPLSHRSGNCWRLLFDKCKCMTATKVATELTSAAFFVSTVCVATSRANADKMESCAWPTDGTCQIETHSRAWTEDDKGHPKPTGLPSSVSPDDYDVVTQLTNVRVHGETKRQQEWFASVGENRLPLLHHMAETHVLTALRWKGTLWHEEVEVSSRAVGSWKGCSAMLLCG